MSFIRARSFVSWHQPAPTKRSHWAAHRGSAAPSVCCTSQEASSFSTPVASSAVAAVQVVTGAHWGLQEAARLLSVAFDDGHDSEPSQLDQLLYQLKLTTVLWWQALLLRERFTMLVAVGPHEGGPPAGIASLTPNRGTQAIPRPWPSQLLTLRIGVISNMAVQPTVRRRGIGRALLAACECVAVQQGAYDIVALLVHEYNEAAVRLYQSSGYAPVPEWTDPDWLEHAQKGRVGPMRRILMVKLLSHAGEPDPAASAVLDKLSSSGTASLGASSLAKALSAGSG